MAKGLRRTTVSIVRAGPAWRIYCDGRVRGLYPFRVDAEEAALRLAREAGARGTPVEILVQESYGEMRPLEPA